MFNKDKDLILRIMNGVFILWFVIALVISANLGMSLLVADEKISFESFKDSGCSEYPYPEKYEKKLTEEQCEAEYKHYEKTYNDTLKHNKINFYTTLFQLAFVSGTLFIINRKKEK